MLLPVFGIMHAGLLVGSLHWIIQLLHVGVGLAGIGMIQRITRHILAPEA